MQPITAALIGAQNTQAVQEMAEFEVVAICDINLEQESIQQALAAPQSKDLKVYTDYRQMLDEAQVEAVIIRTPHYLHAPMTIAALEKGSHVLVEKPPAPVMEECQPMLEAQERSGKLVAVRFQRVADPGALAIKQAVAAGKLGRIREVIGLMLWYRADSYYQGNPWKGKRKYDGYWQLDGVLVNQAIHYVYQGLFLGGEQKAPAVSDPTRNLGAALYRAHATEELEVDDIACVIAELDGDPEKKFCFYATTCAEGQSRTTIEVIGEKGRAVWDNGVGEIRVEGEDPIRVEGSAGTWPVYSNFAAAIRQGATIHAPLAEAIKGVKFVNQAYQRLDWQIKRISWEDTTDLTNLLERAAQARALPGDLPDAPAWARR